MFCANSEIFVMYKLYKLRTFEARLFTLDSETIIELKVKLQCTDYNFFGIKEKTFDAVEKV